MVGKTDQARTAGLLDAPMAPGTRVTVSISEAQLEKILKADEKGKAAQPNAVQAREEAGSRRAQAGHAPGSDQGGPVFSLFFL